MLMEERYQADGCSCGVPLVACALGPTCPACGTVMPEIDIAEHHEVFATFSPRRESKGAVKYDAQFPALKPRAMYYDIPNPSIRTALHLHLKNIGCESNRRDRDRCIELDTVCQGLGYPPTVQRFAWFYYMKVRRSEHVQNSHGLLAASLHAAAREILACVSLWDIITAFNSHSFPVTTRDVSRAHAKFKKYLPQTNILPERYLFKVMADLSDSPRIKRSLADAGLDMDEAFVNIVRKSKAILHANRSLAGQASIKCAAAVFLAFKQCKVKIGAPTFASAINACEGNLRNVAAAFAGSNTRKGVKRCR